MCGKWVAGENYNGLRRFLITRKKHFVGYLKFNFYSDEKIFQENSMCYRRKEWSSREYG
jgi:hypothetical protein